MPTNKELLAKKRNWLLFRLTGAQTIFSLDNRQLMSSLLSKDQLNLIDKADLAIETLIDALKEAKS